MVAEFVGTRPRSWWEINVSATLICEKCTDTGHIYTILPLVHTHVDQIHTNVPTLATFTQFFHWYTHVDRMHTNKSIRWPRAWKSDPPWGGLFEVLTPVVALLYMCVQAVLGAHLGSCTVGTGSLSRGCFGRWPPHAVTCYRIAFISVDLSRECGNMKFVHSIRSLPSPGTVQMTVSKYTKIAWGGVYVGVGVCGLELMTQSIWKHK